jgi:hypothetical protein
MVNPKNHTGQNYLEREKKLSHLYKKVCLKTQSKGRLNKAKSEEYQFEIM